LSPYGPPTRCNGSQVLFHRPTDCDRKDLPLLLWVHGGGMILGSSLAQRLTVGICQDEGWPASPSIESLGKMWVRHVWELSNWAKFQRSSNILKMERNKNTMSVNFQQEILDHMFCALWWFSEGPTRHI
jgi:hypothetical protein